MPIETYINLFDDKTKEQVLPIISYIEDHYENAVFDEKYSEKTRIPTWRLCGKYVAVGCEKKYISVYFASIEAVEAVKESTHSPYVVARKGCVNICYRIKEMPYEAIFKGIDLTFKPDGVNQMEFMPVT